MSKFLNVDNEMSFRVVHNASDLGFSHNNICFIMAGVFRIFERHRCNDGDLLS